MVAVHLAHQRDRATMPAEQQQARRPPDRERDHHGEADRNDHLPPQRPRQEAHSGPGGSSMASITEARHATSFTTRLR
jgi:hypothetical protein